MSEMIDDAPTVEQSILRGEYDADIQRLADAIAVRRRYVNISGTALKVKVGSRVKFVRGRPRYLIGEMATVTRVMQTWVMLQLDRDCGKFSAHVDIRSPMSIIEVL